MRAAWLAVDAAAAEDVLDVLLPVLEHGVHERDRGDVLELVVCDPPGEDVLRAAAGTALRGLRVGALPDDAAARRRALHEPRVVAGRFHLRPAWAPPVEGLVDVVLEDGPAFGTGAHPTTRMVLALLAELADERAAAVGSGGELGAFLDLGCGSGVLSVAAARLGFGPVTAVDADPAAVTGTRAAAARNGLAIAVDEADLLAGAPPPADDVVAANVRLDVLQAVGAGWGRPPAVALVSGIAPEEAEAAAAAFAMCEVRRLEAGGWAALRLERRA